MALLKVREELVFLVCLKLSIYASEVVNEACGSNLQHYVTIDIYETSFFIYVHLVSLLYICMYCEG